MILSKQHFNQSRRRNIFIWTLVLLTLLFSGFAHAQFWKKEQAALLPSEEAFQVVASVNDRGELSVDWTIAEGYYMYRDQFGVDVATTAASVGSLVFPQGVVEDDPEFGEVEVYFYNALLQAPISFSEKTSTLDITLKGQGCNKPVGVCYPPISRTVSIEIPPQVKVDVTTTEQTQSPQTQSSEPKKSFTTYVLSAFIAGVLLSFTPCVLPMIPILAGIIAGQHNPSRWRSGWLAICYVAGTIVTYIVAGALAGATGAQLQAYFQNIWVIGFICLLLVALAASLFGLYRIELPSALQTRLSNQGKSTHSAPISSFALGLISALVVGACVSPILILTLGAAIKQGDPVLGGALMGSMALGMGSLLILFGFGAGWILPRAGAWMNQIQILFGFMVLGVAIYLLGSLPWVPSLYLWAALLLVSGFYLWHLAANLETPIGNSLARAISAVLLIWGAMAIVGGSLNGSDILRPLQGLSSNTSAQAQDKLKFSIQYDLADVKQEMAQATQQGKPVLIDFYADWCLDCTRMDRTTFRSSNVHQALADWHLIKIDVTDTSKRSEEVKRYFEVFGPPATLFYSAEGVEISNLRQYGFINESNFLDLVSQVK